MAKYRYLHRWIFFHSLIFTFVWSVNTTKFSHRVVDPSIIDMDALIGQIALSPHCAFIWNMLFCPWSNRGSLCSSRTHIVALSINPNASSRYINKTRYQTRCYWNENNIATWNYSEAPYIWHESRNRWNKYNIYEQIT